VKTQILFFEKLIASKHTAVSMLQLIAIYFVGAIECCLSRCKLTTAGDSMNYFTLPTPSAWSNRI